MMFYKGLCDPQRKMLLRDIRAAVVMSSPRMTIRQILTEQIVFLIDRLWICLHLFDHFKPPQKIVSQPV
jgi:hypothetical protein